MRGYGSDDANMYSIGSIGEAAFSVVDAPVKTVAANMYLNINGETISSAKTMTANMHGRYIGGETALSWTAPGHIELRRTLGRINLPRRKYNEYYPKPKARKLKAAPTDSLYHELAATMPACIGNDLLESWLRLCDKAKETLRILFVEGNDITIIDSNIDASEYSSGYDYGVELISLPMPNETTKYLMFLAMVRKFEDDGIPKKNILAVEAKCEVHDNFDDETMLAFYERMRLV